MDVQTFGQNWNRLKDDPIALENILFTDATVRCNTGQCFQGVVQAVDPDSKSIMLARVESSRIKALTLCVGGGIEEVITSTTKSKYAGLVEKIFAPTKVLTIVELEQRQGRLLEHLKSRNLPCNLKGNTIHISTWAHIEPPYTLKELFCNNEIIQERVSDILNEFD